MICAGCIQVGWDARTGTILPGALSSIDNCSGHYKPNLEALRNCLRVLSEDGVDIARVRVSDWTQFPYRVTVWWGDDLLNGGPPWTDDEQPTRGWQVPIKMSS